MRITRQTTTTLTHTEVVEISEGAPVTVAPDAETQGQELPPRGPGLAKCQPTVVQLRSVGGRL